MLADQWCECGPPVDTSLVRLLLKHGADANALDYQRLTPLHVAISGGLHEVVEVLLDESNGARSRRIEAWRTALVAARLTAPLPG